MAKHPQYSTEILFFSCEETDLRELNLPVGCRRKLQRAFKTQSKPQQQSLPDADVQRQVPQLHGQHTLVQHVISRGSYMAELAPVRAPAA